MYQLCEFLGRFLPTVVPWLYIRERTVSVALFVRLALVISCILSMVLPNTMPFSNAAFRMAEITTLAFTNGWFATVVTMHLPNHVTGAADKSTASGCGVAAAYIGVVAGQWLSKLTKTLAGH